MASDRDRQYREYEKPRLRVIELAAEEVLGAGCKLEFSGVAPLAAPCEANNCELSGTS